MRAQIHCHLCMVSREAKDKCVHAQARLPYASLCAPVLCMCHTSCAGAPYGPAKVHTHYGAQDELYTLCTCMPVLLCSGEAEQGLKRGWVHGFCVKSTLCCCLGLAGTWKAPLLSSA